MRDVDQVFSERLLPRRNDVTAKARIAYLPKRYQLCCDLSAAFPVFFGVLTYLDFGMNENCAKNFKGFMVSQRDYLTLLSSRPEISAYNQVRSVYRLLSNCKHVPSTPKAYQALKIDVIHFQVARIIKDLRNFWIHGFNLWSQVATVEFPDSDQLHAFTSYDSLSNEWIPCFKVLPSLAGCL